MVVDEDQLIGGAGIVMSEALVAMLEPTFDQCLLSVRGVRRHAHDPIVGSELLALWYRPKHYLIAVRSCLFEPVALCTRFTAWGPKS